MKFIIQVSIRNVYGVEKIYPICETAKLFTNLLGQTTLTQDDVRNIKALGYSFEVVSPATEL